MGSLATADEPLLPPLKYPQARGDNDIVDDYHGVLVPDPYRWMEELDSKELKEFVDAQAAVASAVLSTCDHRGRLRGQLTALFDHPRFRAPFKRRGSYFYFHNPGLRPHSALYVQRGLGGEPGVLLDPNTFSDDGTVSLGMVGVSDDGEHLAYGTRASGSDWVTIRVMRVRDKEHLPDTLSWVKFSRIAWTRDGRGFFYSRFPAPREGGGAMDSGIKTDVNLNHEVYYHFLGTEQSQDVLCWRDPDHPKYMYTPEVTEDGKYVILSVSETSEPVNKLYYCDLSALAHGLGGGGTKSTHGNGMLPFVKLVDRFEAYYGLIANDGTEFTFLTNKDAPRYKLARVDVARGWLQRPDLFGCALAHVGVMDMLRFHKFTIGRAWTCDFGCSENEEEFHWLIKYSPLHNVRRPWEEEKWAAASGNPTGGQYPPTMLLTADHDDRVVPSHTLKFLATMQHVLRAGAEGSPQTNPIIARIERNSGHCCGRSTHKIIDEAADRYAFAAKMMGVSWID